MTADRDASVSGNDGFNKPVQSDGTPQDLLRQLDSARQALEAQLQTLRSADTANVHQGIEANASARLQRLNLLRLQLARGATDVAALRAEITSAVTATLAYTSQIASTVSGSQTANSERATQMALQQASSAARRTTEDFERDFYQRRIFDPYLRFASAEDERAYREREAERQREIESARAEGTPQGDLRAVNLSIDQLNDAGAHGADRSREFKPRLDALHKSSDALATAIAAKQGTAVQQAEPSAPTTVPVDPLAAVKAKSPDTKGAVAALLAAGLSAPQSDNIGHGVNSQTVQATSPTRTI